jgi:hypothetical protein
MQYGYSSSEKVVEIKGITVVTGSMKTGLGD